MCPFYAKKERKKKYTKFNFLSLANAKFLLRDFQNAQKERAWESYLEYTLKKEGGDLNA